jgi:hypothetical protein
MFDEQAGHAWLAQHYKWGLDRAFLKRQHSHVIVIEGALPWRR